MSFCSSLRRRASCSSLLPVIQARPLLLCENNLRTHDLTVQIPSFQLSDRQAKFVVLTPSAMRQDGIDAMFVRLEHFAVLTGGKDCGLIVFLRPTDDWPPAHHALNPLQIALARKNMNIPVLPLITASALPNVLAAFVRTIVLNASLRRTKNAAMDLLPFCTLDTPMRHETLIALTDQTTCLKEIASLKEEDLVTLADGAVKDQETQAMLGFWTEEWVAE